MAYVVKEDIDEGGKTRQRFPTTYGTEGGAVFSQNIERAKRMALPD